MSNLSWDQQLVTAKYWYPKFGAIYTGEGLGEAPFLADGTPFTWAQGLYSFTLTRVAPNQERLDVNFSTNVTFSNSIFNGPLISGSATDAPILSAVLLSAPENGFNQTDVGHDANSVWLNESNLLFPPNSTLSVLLTFDVHLPAAANGTLVVGHDQTVNVTSFLQGLVTPALPTDYNTITGVTGLATLSLGSVTYAAPSTGPDSFVYTIADPVGHTAAGTVSVTVDPGPTLSKLTIVAPPATPLDLTNIIKGSITPGLAGDVVSLTGASPGAIFDPTTRKVTYTSALGDTHATFNVSFKDQLGDTASGPVYVQLGHDNSTVYLSGFDNVVDAPAITLSGSSNTGGPIVGPAFGGAVIEGTRLSETITARGYANTVRGNGGSDTINAGVSQAHVTVSDLDGNNVVTGFVGNSTVTLGDGTNFVDLGAYGNYIHLGNGDNKVSGGAGNAEVVVGNGINTILFGGYNNRATLGYGTNTVDIGYGSARITILGGTAKLTAHGFNDVFDISHGTTTISGLAGYATINLGASFNVDDSVDIAEGAGYVIKFANSQLVVTKPDGELIATVTAPFGKALKAVPDGAGGTKIVLSGSSIVPPVPPVAPAPPIAPTVITETLWGVNITLAPATKVVHLAGYSNTVVGADGDHTIDGDNGGLILTLGSGNNIVAVNGYNDVIKLGVDALGHFTGTGNNIVSGTLGNTIIHTGAGNQTITAAGYTNVITTGAGNSVIMAGAGSNIVDTGNGSNDITAWGNTNTVITHQGTANVHLNGWTNLIEAGAGHTIVSGGYYNTYQVQAVSTSPGVASGVDVLDFSTLFGDVLDLHPIAAMVGIANFSEQNVGGDLKVFANIGGNAIQVANLHGMAGETLASLLVKHSLTF
jgi:hypothetical protein